jgi:hypothetical protein
MSEIKKTGSKPPSESGTVGPLPDPKELTPPFDPDEYTSDYEPALIGWLNGIDGGALPKETIVVYEPKMNPRPIAEKIHEYGGPEKVPPNVRAKWKKMGVTIREQTDEEAKRIFIHDQLLKLFGSIHQIDSIVSTEGLAKLGLEVEHHGTSWTLKKLEEKKKSK